MKRLHPCFLALACAGALAAASVVSAQPGMDEPASPQQGHERVPGTDGGRLIMAVRTGSTASS